MMLNNSAYESDQQLNFKPSDSLKQMFNSLLNDSTKKSTHKQLSNTDGSNNQLFTVIRIKNTFFYKKRKLKQEKHVIIFYRMTN
jgi:hypothetical protein